MERARNAGGSRSGEGSRQQEVGEDGWMRAVVEDEFQGDKGENQLSVKKGEEVWLDLSGDAQAWADWVWARNSRGECGYIPASFAAVVTLEKLGAEPQEAESRHSKDVGEPGDRKEETGGNAHPENDKTETRAGEEGGSGEGKGRENGQSVPKTGLVDERGQPINVNSKVQIMGVVGYVEPKTAATAEELPDVSGMDLDKLNLDEYPQLKLM